MQRKNDFITPRLICGIRNSRRREGLINFCRHGMDRILAHDVNL